MTTSQLALATSFSLISGQLSTIGAQLEQNNLQLQEGNEKLSQIISLSRANLLATGAMQKEIKEKLTLQIEAADLNNALIQKSNESSKDMIRELSSFKKELKSR